MILRRALAAACAAVLLAGCSAPTPAGPVTASANPNTAELISQRERAGLPDCEVPSGRVEPVTGGLPDLELPCLGSDRVLNLSQVRGRPLVINLWAQWCPPCRAESPYLREFAARAGDKVRIIGIDYDDPDPASAIELAGLVGWAYPHLVDSNSLLKSRLNVVGIPTTLFVGADGRIVYRTAGPVASTDELAGLVKQYLKVTV